MPGHATCWQPTNQECQTTQENHINKLCALYPDEAAQRSQHFLFDCRSSSQAYQLREKSDKPSTFRWQCTALRHIEGLLDSDVAFKALAAPVQAMLQATLKLLIQAACYKRIGITRRLQEVVSRVPLLHAEDYSLLLKQAITAGMHAMRSALVSIN